MSDLRPIVEQAVALVMAARHVDTPWLEWLKAADAALKADAAPTPAADTRAKAS